MSEALNILNYLRVPKPLGIIHVGANSGQEIEAYQNSSAQSCVYIEPIPHIFKQLKPTFRRYLSQFNFQVNCSK